MKLFAWLGSLLVIVIAAAFVVPPYVDWNRFRTQFEREASRALGQRVEVRGTTSARLLPVPSVTFTDIRVGPEDQPHLLADSFAMDVEPAPLLKGDVVVRDMRLNAPRLFVRIDENGTLSGTVGQGTMAQRSVAVNNISVTNGAVRFVDARIGRELLVSDVNVNASADALTGPWRGAGMVTVRGERLQLTARTGQWQDAGAITLNLDIEPQAHPFHIRYEGPVQFDAALPHLTGRLLVDRVGAAGPSGEMEPDGKGLVGGLPVHIEADLDATPDLVRVPAYEMKIGRENEAGDQSYTVTGSGDFVLDSNPSFQLKLQGQQVDVARFENALGVSHTVEGRTFQERVNALAASLTSLAYVPDNGVIDIELPAIVSDGTIVRDVAMRVRPVSGETAWSVSGLRAELPGRTRLRADGILGLQPALSFTGDLAVASNQPSGFSKWLGAANDDVISAMGNAGFEAKAELGNGRLKLDDLEIILDGARLRGAMARLEGEGGRGLIDLTLRGERADFDQMAAWAELFTGEEAVTAGHDLSVDLDAERVVYNGLEAEQVVAQATLADGMLDLALLEIGDLAGLALSANGGFVRSGGNGLPQDGHLTVGVSANTIGPALNLLEQRLPVPLSLDRLKRDAALFENTELVFDLTASDGALEFDGAGESNGTHIALDGSISSEWDLNARLVLDAPSGALMLAQVGVPVLPQLAQQARGGLRLTLDGPLGGPLRSSAILTMPTGYASAGGNLSFTLVDGTLQPAGQLDVTAEASNLDPFIAMSGLRLPGYGLGLNFKSTFDLSLSETGMEATGLAGHLAGSSYSGRLALERDDNGKPVLTGALSVEALSGAMLAGLALNERQLFVGLGGVVQLDVAEVALSETGLPPVRDMRGQLMLDGGDLALRDASGLWLDGRLEGDLSLARSGAVNLAGGTVALRGADIAVMAEALNLPPFMSGRFEGTGSFEAAADAQASLRSALTGSGSARLTNGRLNRIAVDTLPQALAAADATEDVDLPAQASTIVRDALTNGGVAFGETELSFAMANGVVRSDGVPFSDGPVTAIGRGRADLSSGAYDVRLDVAFEAGREAVEGIAPSLTVKATGAGSEPDVTVESTAFETFLNMRLAERRERMFAARLAAIAQRQRIADTVRLYDLKAQARRRAEEAAARAAAEAEAEAKRKREEAARRKAEAERKAREAAEQRRREEELRRRANEAANRLQRDAPPPPDGGLDFRGLGVTE